MKFYTDAEQRHARAQAARKKAALKKRYPVELTDPIAPCGGVSEASDRNAVTEQEAKND